MPIMPAQKINGLQFLKCHIGMKPRFSAMMMSFENTTVSLPNARFRCITAHSTLDYAALCCKDSYPMQANQTVLGIGLSPLL